MSHLTDKAANGSSTKINKGSQTVTANGIKSNNTSNSGSAGSSTYRTSTQGSTSSSAKTSSSGSSYSSGGSSSSSGSSSSNSSSSSNNSSNPSFEYDYDYEKSSGYDSSYIEQLLAEQKAEQERLAEEQAAAEKAAIQAAVDQNVNTLTAQKTDTSDSYADLYRQLYIQNMNSQKNINQQLAAQGQTGGAAESTLLGLNTDYSANLLSGQTSEKKALAELDQAIADAKLSGSIESANSTATAAQQKASAYLTAYQNALSAAQTAAQYEAENTSTNRSYAYQLALQMLQSGSMPSDALLSSAGISKSDAQTILAKYVVTSSSGSSDSPTDDSWKNGLSTSGYYGNETTANGTKGDSKRQEYQDEASSLAYIYQNTNGNISSVLNQLNQDYTKGNISINTYKSLQNYYKNL